MTEAFTNAPNPNLREARLRSFSHEVNPQEVELLRTSADKMGIELPKDVTGIQGGGILATDEDVTEKVRNEAKDNPRAKALVMGKTHGSSEPNVFVHFPTNKEHKEFGANIFAYQGQLGEYLRHHWNRETLGMNPLQGMVSNLRLDDGRQVTAIRYRKNFEPLGTQGKAGIHEMDTNRITPMDLKHLVRVLNETHVDSNTFQTWATETNHSIPSESWMNAQNGMVALRGKEWWISPANGPDRMKELTEHVTKQDAKFRKLDPTFDAAASLADMIKNNIELFPHQDGTIDNADLVGKTVVVHGALHPENVHIRKDNGEPIHITVSGGDRAQGMGLKGQMIDWLVTSAAKSPEHQQALLDEFIRLNPSEKDRRGLAMHVLYRSILEGSWFQSAGKMQEADNLAKLSFDILKGNGIWRGVNTPPTPSK